MSTGLVWICIILQYHDTNVNFSMSGSSFVSIVVFRPSIHVAYFGIYFLRFDSLNLHCFFIG